jgi:hypothetical protein
VLELEHVVDWEPGGPAEPWAGATPCPGLVRLLHRRVRVSVSDGYSAPKPPGNPGGVGREVSSIGNY